MSEARSLPVAVKRAEAEAAMERTGDVAAQEERRRQLQEYLAVKGKLKCSSTKPHVKGHPNPLLKPVAKPGHVARSKEDIVERGARAEEQPGVRSARRAGLGPRQGSSEPPQGAAASERRWRSTRLPSTNPSARPGAKLPTHPPSHRGAGRTEEAAAEAVAAASLPQAPHSLSKGLHERLLCDKENLPGQAPGKAALSSRLGSAGDGHRRALAARQSSATASRATRDPKDTVKSVEPIQHGLGKSLPGSKDTLQMLSSRTRVLQRPPLQSISRTQLHNKAGAKPESANPARLPLGKAAGTLPAGDFKHHNRAPQLKRSPTKPPAHGGPRGAAKPGCPQRCGPRPGSSGRQPAASGETGRKDAKEAPQGRAAPAKATGPTTATHGAPRSKTPALEAGKETLQQAALPTASVQAKRVPKTPTPEDRKKQLQEWLASKGKSYKRPPMMLPPKKPSKEKLLSKSRVQGEKEKSPEQLLLDKINSVFSNCLEYIEKGGPCEGLLEMLARVPGAERFGQFWVCKAKLLARAGPFDATGLYKDAVCAGAVPLQELREVIVGILKSRKRTWEGDACPAGPAGPCNAGEAACSACPSTPAECDRPHPPPGHGGEQAEPPVLCEPVTPCPSERLHAPETPCLTGKRLPGSSIKFQLLSISSEGREWKLLTPVRRSRRVEWAGSRYPRMLKDHDTVVASLNEILAWEEDIKLLFRNNKALPELAELEIWDL